MTLAAAPAASVRPPLAAGARAASAGGAAGLALVVALFVLGHPHAGIMGDASLYLGRALADLDPAGVGRDITFLDDGQSRFSLFPQVLTVLVASLGAQQASLVAAAVAVTCLLAASLALARALTADRRVVLAILALAAVVPIAYGDDVFRAAEAAAVPRPFAEAAVVAAIAALLRARSFRAAAWLVVALLLHPLMAMAGLGTAVVLLAWRRSARATLAAGLAFAALGLLAAGLGALGVPLLSRLVQRIDPDWLALLRERSPHLFPSLWHADALVAPLAQVTTIAAAAMRGGIERRRVLAAVAISAILQLCLAAALGDAAASLLAIQLQGWRALWLLGTLAVACLPLVAVELWREGPQARLALALLGLAWLCPLGIVTTAATCLAALVLRSRAIVLPLAPRHGTWALAMAAALIGAAAVAGLLAWARFLAAAPPGADIGLLSAIRGGVLVAPCVLAVAIWLLAPARIPRLATASFALAAGLAAVVSFDQRIAADAFFARQDGFAPASVAGDLSSEVLVIGGLSGAWFALARPQYVSPQQAVGVVFSRALAMEWRRRAALLRDIGLAPSNIFHPFSPLGAGDPVRVTLAKLAALCARPDAPAIVIVPDREDAPAPALPGAIPWRLATPRPILERYARPQWHAIRGWEVVPCRLAQSAAR